MAKKIEYDWKAGKTYSAYNYRAKFGRANIQVICPFCGSHFTGYIWSMAGCGKKCPGCGALHTSRMAYPPTESQLVKLAKHKL